MTLASRRLDSLTGPGSLAVLIALSAVTLPADMALGADVSQPTAAQKETARNLVLSGRAKRIKGNAEGALGDFKAAYASVKNPTTGFELGRIQAELGRLVEARDTLLEVGRMPLEPREPAALSRARADAKELADELSADIPSIRLELLPASGPEPVEVKIDGSVVAADVLSADLKQNPGLHRIDVRQGLIERKVQVTLARKERREITIDLSVSEDASPGVAGGTHWLVWTGLATLGVGATVGGVLGGFAVARSNELAAGCPGGKCPPPLHDTVDEAQALAAGATVGFVLAGAGAAALVVGLFLPGDAAEQGDTPPAPIGSLRWWSPPGEWGVGLEVSL